MVPVRVEPSILDDGNVPIEISEVDAARSEGSPWFDQLSPGWFSDATSTTTAPLTDGRSVGGLRRSTGKFVSQRSGSKDGFLIECKRSGMSYKEIKEKGHFEEAESTLRGRFRTLTKRKEYRVRKPGWKENDVGLR